ncbi:MAG: hypothetical protein KC444_10280 [Nitrosopumilus sp.]|nr:hypothetical protein [Nitrosopumilus sp.]
MKKNLIRKIIKIEYSRLVSLPPFWLDTVGLEAGDFIQIRLGKNKELILTPQKRKIK